MGIDHGYHDAVAGGGHQPSLVCDRQSQDDLPEMLAHSEEQAGPLPVRDDQRERSGLELPSLRMERGI